MGKIEAARIEVVFTLDAGYSPTSISHWISHVEKCLMQRGNSMAPACYAEFKIVSAKVPSDG